MPEKKRVFAVANLLLGRGEPVSLRTVIKTLPGGGSNREVGPHLRDWKIEHNYKPKLRVEDLPERLQAELARFVRLAWDEAKVDAAARFNIERETLEAERRANDDLRNEALVSLDVSEARNLGLKSEAAALRAENERLKARLDRIRAEEFWDRVMLEVRDVMPAGGTMPMGEVLAKLKQSIHRGARLHKEPLNEATLRKKMAVRAFYLKYFKEDEHGNLVREAG